MFSSFLSHYFLASVVLILPLFLPRNKSQKVVTTKDAWSVAFKVMADLRLFVLHVNSHLQTTVIKLRWYGGHELTCE